MTSGILAALLTISGAVPAALQPAVRVAWVDGGASTSATCGLTTSSRWQCSGLPEHSAGLVLVVGDAGVAAVAPGNAGAGPIKSWGRVLVLPDAPEPGGKGSSAPISAWKPERSAVRTRTKRFVPLKDPTFEAVRISARVYWVGGDDIDPDGFVVVDIPGLASARIPIAALRTNAPEEPFFVPAEPSLSLMGVVTTVRNDVVPDAELELFEPLPTRPDGAATRIEEWPMVRRAVVRTDSAGQFDIGGLAQGAYLLFADHGADGRATIPIASVLQPLVVRLEPPIRLTGRVLRHQLPAAGARVRFVPHAATLADSEDPRDVLAPETMTASDGRFTLVLPPVTDGEVQIIGTDGAVLRLPAPDPGDADHHVNEHAIGDVVLPDHRRLTVRLLDDDACEMSAAGPMGSLGLTVVRAAAAGNVYWFDLPEAGDWVLAADCSSGTHSVSPMVVSVPAAGPDAKADVHLAK